MTRVPISFYLNILAGIVVLFNHYVASETGDVALNKVIGASDRFYTLFRDTALEIQRGCTSRFETALCGPAGVGVVLPQDAAEHLRARYCHLPVLDSETVGGDQQHHWGYGDSYLAFVYYQPPINPLVPRWSNSAEDPPGLRRSLFSLGRSSQRRLSQVVSDRSSEAMVMVGALLFRACASWWWLRAPLKMTGFLLAACAAWSALGYLFGVSAVVAQVRVASGFLNANRLLTCIGWQVHMVIVTDFLRCIEWEAQRRALDIGVMMMERAYGLSRMSVNAHR